MKIFIWIASFFVIVGIPEAVVMQFFDIKFGFIPTVIFAGLAYWTAKTLCKKWDAHKASRENADMQEETIQTECAVSAPYVPTYEASTVKVSAVAKRKKTAISRDTETDMVTANNSNEINTEKPANKKKSIFNKFSVSIAVLFILLSSSIGINIYQTYKNTQHQNNINALSEELESAQKNWEYYANRFSSVSSEKKEMQRKVINLENTLSFYEEHVVIVPDDNKNTYHIYGCKYCDTSYFWAYNTKAAQDSGYSPCKYCCS